MANSEIEKLAGAARETMEQIVKALEGEIKGGLRGSKNLLKYQRESILASSTLGKIRSMERFFAQEGI